MRRPLTNKDGEVRELTAADFKAMRPIAEVDPGMIDAMKEFHRKVGRPKAISPKVHVSFRMAADVVASIKATGRGYNARVEQALREAGFGEEEKRKPSSKGAARSAEKKRVAAAQAAKRAAGSRAPQSSEANPRVRLRNK